MITYLMTFVLTWWPHVADYSYQLRETKAVVSETAALHTTGWKKLRLLNVAALESGFRRNAVGPLGERGAWQILGGTDFSAKEALRRMDQQGMVAYVGCRHVDDKVVVQGGVKTTCRELIAHRIDKADLFFMAFDPPAENDIDSVIVLGGLS
jgi:hypothetical protein